MRLITVPSPPLSAIVTYHLHLQMRKLRLKDPRSPAQTHTAPKCLRLWDAPSLLLPLLSSSGGIFFCSTPTPQHAQNRVFPLGCDDEEMKVCTLLWRPPFHISVGPKPLPHCHLPPPCTALTYTRHTHSRGCPQPTSHPFGFLENGAGERRRMVQRQTENPGGEGCTENQREADNNPFSPSPPPPPLLRGFQS